MPPRVWIKVGAAHGEEQELGKAEVVRRLSAAADKAKTAPGADKVLTGYTTAARGLGKATGSTATRTVSSKHVIKQYQRAGHDIEGLAGIQ